MLYTKSQTLFNKKDDFHYVLYTKKQTPYVTRFFMKNLKLEFILKKHDTLRYVTFIYIKS